MHESLITKVLSETLLNKCSLSLFTDIKYEAHQYVWSWGVIDTPRQ